MSDPSASQSEQPPQQKNDDVIEMAARLFAELFYKQVMMEREEKPRRAASEQVDSSQIKIDSHFNNGKPNGH